jgi:hypothetical protein
MNTISIPLIGLKADHFRHPLDQTATAKLKQIPGMDLIVRGLLGSVAEQFFALNNLAASVRVGKNQLPHLYQLYQLLVDATLLNIVIYLMP